jgi:hypothetical protein
MGLTFADSDSVAGTWTVAGYNPTIDLGFWNADAYVLYARTTSTVVTPDLVAHRFATTTDGATCSLRAIDVLSNGDIVSIPYGCRLTYLGP